jgi:hypothetical protein
MLNLGLGEADLETVRDVVQKVVSALPTEHEVQWIEVLREANSHSDPPLSKRARTAISSIFGR